MVSTWLRSIGGAFQILGVLMVALELHRVRQAFPPDRPGIVRRAVRRLLHRKPEAQVVKVSAADSLDVALSAEVQVWSDEWDTDRKIAELRQQIARLCEKAGTLGRQIREEGDNRRREIRERLLGVRDQIRATDEKVGRLATGSLHIRWYGLAFLVAGIALTTWPTEIARSFGGS